MNVLKWNFCGELKYPLYVYLQEILAHISAWSSLTLWDLSLGFIYPLFWASDEAKSYVEILFSKFLAIQEPGGIEFLLHNSAYRMREKWLFWSPIFPRWTIYQNIKNDAQISGMSRIYVILTTQRV